MKSFRFGRSEVSERGPCYVISEIGNNHQGELKTALKIIKVAAGMGVNAVKFQKRDNKILYTDAMYNKAYDNENSYGATYGAHRDFLEFGWDQYVELKGCADENEVEFIATPFDIPSVDFLERLGVASYKIASGDLTNTPLIDYVARLGKPMFISTGASSLEEIELAYDTVLQHHDKFCLLHCTAGYPTEYENLNLKAITTLKNEFPKAIIGFSGHDYGILAPVIAYMLGASVVEKHVTLNRAWKGTDHRFSLEPTGLHKLVRDLRRVDQSMGDGVKVIQNFERDARAKMAKSLYAARTLPSGTTLKSEDIAIKSPCTGGGVPPYRIEEVLGKRLKEDLARDALISLDCVE